MLKNVGILFALTRQILLYHVAAATLGPAAWGSNHTAETMDLHMYKSLPETARVSALLTDWLTMQTLSRENDQNFD